ncbi:MAG: hypothetical protein FJW69_07485 [Actinobacteria bacterium]|nr:hypothetical protein [Actinomycetota bacterium]MBM3712341.1 hypothetical protein [Actinomycetota bacterium]
MKAKIKNRIPLIPKAEIFFHDADLFASRVRLNSVLSNFVLLNSVLLNSPALTPCFKAALLITTKKSHQEDMFPITTWLI